MTEISQRNFVPMVDLKAQYLPLKEEIKTALKDIIESGQFVLGRNVSSLEKEIAAYHGVNTAIGLASGTDSLHLCLKALGIKGGDEVITTPFTFIASAESIAYVGAKPVFVDIEGDTLNIDASKIEEKITSKTTAIVIVHLFGRPTDMSEIMEIANKYDLFVVEDCAQAFGAKYREQPVGSIGDAGCFSFYPSKNLGAYGDGGMMITNNTDLYEKVSMLRNHGTTGPYEHSFLGYNSRLDEIQAAILRIKLKHIDEYNQKRGNIAGLYTSVLDGHVACPKVTPDRTHVFHQYTIRSPFRDRIKDALLENAISSVVYYPLPLHLQKAFKYLGHSKGDFPECEAAAKEVLSIPIYPEIEPETAEYIARTILKAL
jgi:UDP-2-acetamido-2-deoxy-ribo-hexuluronate aminotransferase